MFHGLFERLSEDQEHGRVLLIKMNEEGYESLMPMLQHLENAGNVGHSLSVEMDDDKYGWDGDGNARILGIIDLTAEEVKAASEAEPVEGE